MADLLAAHFSGGSLVAAKLGGGERPVCGNPGTGALWRDLGFVAQRYVVKVLWYSKNNNFVFFLFFWFVVFFPPPTQGAQLASAFHTLFLGILFFFFLKISMHFAFVVLTVVLQIL